MSLSIDDYGTGFSSLSRLKDLPFKELKIDRSFVTGMIRDKGDEAIVRSTIELGRSLGRHVTAEGVEDQATLHRLASLGCHAAQGFYLARPLPAQECERWLSSLAALAPYHGARQRPQRGLTDQARGRLAASRGCLVRADLRRPSGLPYASGERPSRLEGVQGMARTDATGPAGALDHDLTAALQRLSSRFFADAPRSKRAESIPDEHLKALADAGFYGLFAPAAAGGLGLGYPGMCSVVEELSSGCLASTFVWAQHFRFLGAMLQTSTPAPLREKYLRPAVTGEVKGGVALTGLLPGPPRLMARPAPGGWLLEGEAPWVSGWGTVDVIVVLARGPDGTVVTLLLDAKPQPGLSVTPLRLVAHQRQPDREGTVRGRVRRRRYGHRRAGLRHGPPAVRTAPAQRLVRPRPGQEVLLVDGTVRPGPGARRLPGGAGRRRTKRRPSGRPSLGLRTGGPGLRQPGGEPGQPVGAGRRRRRAAKPGGHLPPGVRQPGGHQELAAGAAQPPGTVGRSARGRL